ncbi:MAG: hypothetical protein JW733_00830 [Coriobacteriia bacterium]|nr:hypothetical protein [Coriobacteriia bacterium]
MIDLVPIAVGSGSPAGCTRCAPIPDAAYLSVSDIAAALAAARGTHGVALVGPEPFSHPELPRVIAACRDAGFKRIALETDGSALAVHGNAPGVLHAGVRHLWVRVLGAHDAAHDERIGRPGRGAAARAGCAAYRAAALEMGRAVVVTAVVPVCRHTLPELHAIVAECGARGFDAVRLVSTGPLSASAEAMIEAACDTGMVNRIWVSTDGSLPLPASHRLHGVADGVASGGGQR